MHSLKSFTESHMVFVPSVKIRVVLKDSEFLPMQSSGLMKSGTHLELSNLNQNDVLLLQNFKLTSFPIIFGLISDGYGKTTERKENKHV